MRSVVLLTFQKSIFEYCTRFRCFIYHIYTCQKYYVRRYVCMYVTTLYLSCRKDISRGKMWKVSIYVIRCCERFVRQIARRQFLPLETITPTVTSWAEFKGEVGHYKFSASLIRLQPAQLRALRSINRKDNCCKRKIGSAHPRQSGNADERGRTLRC